MVMFNPELPADGINLAVAIAALESCLIRQALERTKGNKNRAAALLGVKRTTLVMAMKRLFPAGSDGLELLEIEGQ